MGDRIYIERERDGGEEIERGRERWGRRERGREMGERIYIERERDGGEDIYREGERWGRGDRERWGIGYI